MPTDTTMRSVTDMQEFLALLTTGKAAALDFQPETGEFACRKTVSLDGRSIGAGTPGVPYSTLWKRLAEAKGYALTYVAPALKV